MTAGSVAPGQQTHGATSIAPSLRSSTKTAAGQGQAGVSPQTYVVTLPTYSVGDLLIAHVLWNSGILGSPSTPTGWTLRGTQQSGSGASLVTYAYTRIADGSEGTTVTFNEVTVFKAVFSAAVSSWLHVSPSAPIASTNGSTSGSFTSATWTGGSVTVPAGIASTVATVVTSLLGHGSGDDFVPTAPAALSYDYDDTSQIVSNADFRFAIASYLSPTSGAHTAAGTFTGGASHYYGGIGLVLLGG